MPYGTPANPVSGTVITVAYAVANLLDPIRWLRIMTGNADPPGSAYVVVSDSSSGASWNKVPTDAIADGAVTTPKLADGAVTTPKLATAVSSTISANTAAAAAAQSTANTGVSNAAAAQSTANTASTAATNAQNTANTAITNAATANTNAGNAQTTANNANALAASKIDQATGDSRYFRLDVANTTHANITVIGAALVADNITLAGVPLTPSVSGVPTGCIAGWDTGTSVPSGWTRKTAMNGRMAVGDGTTFSVTFTVGGAAGTGSWSHNHAHATTHSHDASTLTVAGNTGNVVGGVSGTSAGGSGSATVGDHQHLPGGLDVGGSIGVSGPGASDQAQWIPPCYVVIWMQKS